MYPVVLLAIVAATAAQDEHTRCWSAGNGGPARWWRQGERVDRGKYWYECENGLLAPRGCFGRRDERLAIGQSYVENGYEMTCTLGKDGYLKFAYTACVDDRGTRHAMGDTWADSQNVYYWGCHKDGQDYLREKIEGCISHDKSRKIPLGESYDFGDYTYQCQQKQNGSVQMCSVGCISGGEHYKVGEQWPEGEYIFYCKLNKGRCRKMAIGCNIDGKQLYDGDRFHKDDTVMQCQVRADSFGQKPVGCVARDSDGSMVERVIGCRWYLTFPTSKLEQTCGLVGEKAKVTTVGCIYRHRGFDTIFLNPGSYTIYSRPQGDGPIGLACRDTNGKVEMVEFGLEQIGVQSANMKFESPRG